jgi:hypothetical protein
MEDHLPVEALTGLWSGILQKTETPENRQLGKRTYFDSADKSSSYLNSVN